MQADTLTLTQLLSISALIGATIQYAELVKKRMRARLEAALRDEIAYTGLRGLVRVLLVNEAP